MLCGLIVTVNYEVSPRVKDDTTGYSTSWNISICNYNESCRHCIFTTGACRSALRSASLRWLNCPEMRDKRTDGQTGRARRKRRSLVHESLKDVAACIITILQCIQYVADKLIVSLPAVTWIADVRSSEACDVRRRQRQQRLQQLQLRWQLTQGSSRMSNVSSNVKNLNGRAL